MVRWQHASGRPFVQLRDEVDRLVGDFFNGASAAMPRTWAAVRQFPAVNVWEEDDHLFAEAELPGLKSTDIDISVAGDELTLSGRRPEPAADAAPYHRRERSVGEFTRTLKLPYDVDADAVEASLSDGILLIKMPKAASARPRKIQVNPGS